MKEAMPRRDLYHDHVRKALENDGWTITDDPLKLKLGGKDLYVDLGAEKLLAAEKEDRKIAVEVKSFVGPSIITELEIALGQYVLYHDIMAKTKPERVLYLAIPDEVYLEIFEEPIGEVLLENKRVLLIVYDPNNEEALKWIH